MLISSLSVLLPVQTKLNLIYFFSHITYIKYLLGSTYLLSCSSSWIFLSTNIHLFRYDKMWYTHNHPHARIGKVELKCRFSNIISWVNLQYTAFLLKYTSRTHTHIYAELKFSIDSCWWCTLTMLLYINWKYFLSTYTHIYNTGQVF